MPGSSTIGALKVDLGLNSAAFTAGLKKASSGLEKFSKTAAIGLAAFAAVATTALGVAVKHSIDHADALSKSAQKAGVTTEALSRLAYAADFSDVSLDGLTGGLQKLSKAMADSLIKLARHAGLSDADIADKLLGPVIEATLRLLPGRVVADKFEAAAARARAKDQTLQ
jgi:hypothetical protein